MAAPRIPNLFAVPELKEKLLFTLMCLAVYRAGAHIATPGVNVQVLADFIRNQGAGTFFGMYDMFVGGGLSRATVLALGIMPYISASIMFQLAGAVFPIVDKLQKDYKRLEQRLEAMYVDKLDGKIVQQLGMRRTFAGQTEVVHRTDQAGSE